MRKGISTPAALEATVQARRTIRLVRIVRSRHTGHKSYPSCLDTVSPVNLVDHMNPTPLYTQLADILREMIKSGELQPRSLLPSESYLQQEHGVSRGTVRMAIAVLRDEGLVVTISARGTFVKARDPQGDE